MFSLSGIPIAINFISEGFSNRRRLNLQTNTKNTLLKMKKKILLVSLFSLPFYGIFAQGPIVTSWKINTTGAHISKGTVQILTDVESVNYDSSTVYIKTSGVPSYYNFTTNTNVNAASDLKETFKITRNPQKNTGTPSSALGGGQYGLAKDGTLVFNGEDARTYQNQNVWHQLAYYFEGKDLDSTLGHSTPSNAYHHHTLDLALQDTTKEMVHSPIQGFAFDGYPIYGPFAFKDPNDLKSKVVRMTPGYQKRKITSRTTLADGTVLTASQYGPTPGGMTPLGCYREDYAYLAGSGTLDDHNGRFCKTPEYTNGTYCYFAILDSQLKPQYPFVFGQTMYGVVDQSNMGPNGGKATVPAGTVKYNPKAGINESYMVESLSFYPNPAKNTIRIVLPEKNNCWYAEIIDIEGRTLITTQQKGNTADINVSALSPGLYLVKATSLDGNISWVGRMVKE
jgi:hypothetical protein